MTTSPSSTESSMHRPASARSRVPLVFLLISALYFLDTLLRTTLKTFWYDELDTIYLCRLPTFHATWTAVLHGADLNPPLFYLLTRWSQHIGGGEGLIASRMPAILGFWIFGACLYFFTARRLGPLCGAIAAILPWFTFAGYYAYEARPHGTLLAWCGLMLVFWQRSRPAGGTRAAWRNPWLLGLSISFLGGLFTHVYAVFLVIPFLLVEAVALLREHSFDLPTCVALAIPPLFVARIYLRMTANYLQGVTSGGLHIHIYEVVQHFLLTIFGPGLILLIVVLALLAWRAQQKSTGNLAARHMTRDELIVAVGLLMLPVCGAIVAKVTRGPFFDRYFLAASAGYAILFTQVIAAYGSRRFVPRFLLGTMLILFTSDALIALYCHLRHTSLDIAGPGNLVVFSPDPTQPFSRNHSLVADTSRDDILVVDHPGYLFFQYYASPSLRRRLIYAAPSPHEEFLQGYRLIQRWTGADLQTTTLSDYFPHHPEFLLYEANRDDCPTCVQFILDAGYHLRSVVHDADGKMERFSR